MLENVSFKLQPFVKSYLKSLYAVTFFVVHIHHEGNLRLSKS